jgi:hypothetical protein
MLSLLTRDQANVAAIMEKMQALLTNPAAAQRSDIDRVRWQLDRVVDRHIHTLTNDVLRWLEINRPSSLERARRVAQAAQDLRSSYTRHKERFSAGPTKETWTDYKASASLLMRSLERLFEAERAEILPLFETA